jgi:hypothetical protein
MTRTPAFIPHRFRPDPDAPGNGLCCSLIERNQVHNPDLVAAQEAKTAPANAESRRRTGETD